MITDSSGRVLLCQQNQGHRLWGLPGGKIRHCESPVRAVARDVREETGLEILATELVGIYQLTGNGCGEGLPDVLVHVFRARIETGEALVNSPSWIRRVTWTDPGELPEPLTATTRIAVADAAAGKAGVLREVQRAIEPEIPDAEEIRVGLPGRRLEQRGNRPAWKAQ